MSEEPKCPKCYQEMGLVYMSYAPYLMCGMCGWEASKPKTPLDWMKILIDLWKWSVKHQ